MKKLLTNKGLWAWAIILAVIAADQGAKVYVKLHFVLRESVEVTSWFHILFIENAGMAYGMELGSKLFLTLFRILAVVGFGYILWCGVRREVRTGFILSLALVVAGAVGNIIDCIFYGQLFTDSYGHVATWAGDGAAGYAPWFHGRVVDMLYFPLVEFDWPQAVPQAGQYIDWGWLSFAWPRWLPCSDEPFRFFAPVFNVADAAISVGFVLLLLFYRHTFAELELPIFRTHKSSTQR